MATKKQKISGIIVQNRGLSANSFVRWPFAMVFFLICINNQAFAQITIPKLQRPTLKLDSSVKNFGSALIKTSLAGDSTQKEIQIGDSELKSTVVYSAKDSTFMDPSAQEVHLYGDAKVTYGKIVLQADYIRLNWKTNEVFARGTYDSTDKKWVGEPIFEDDGEKYDSRELRYNFKTRKGLIKSIVTQQGDGNIRGQSVKKDDNDNLYIRGSMYTTCNMEHPHFFINSKRLKVIPNKQVISGPFNLVIADVPTPLGLPFGFFPIPQKQEIGTSGFLMPQYGEEPNGRGYYLRGGGYYWAISERINLIMTTQIYSKGSWGFGAQSSYSTRYRYSGNFNFNYNRNVAGSEIDALNKPRNDFSLTWSHSPVPRGSSNFGASVNLGSNSYNQFNAFDTKSYTQSSTNSAVQYSKQFGQYGNMSSSVNLSQKLPDRSKVDKNGKQIDPGEINMGIELSGGIQQIAPFALKGGTGRWYESFRLGANFSSGITINNQRTYSDTSNLGFKVAADFDTTGRSSNIRSFPVTMDNIGTMLNNAQFRGNYSIPIALPNIKLKQITMTPSISMSGEMFDKRYVYEYDEKTDMVKAEQKTGLTFANQFSMGMSVNTRIYGMFPIRTKRLEAIRHTIVPYLGFNYTPDQSNLYQYTQVNKKGDMRYLNKYRNIGALQGGVGKSAAGASWSINNMFEAKVRPKSDTAAKQFEKISLLDNLSISGSYDFTRDSIKTSDISMNTALRLYKNLDLSLNANFDPYLYVADPLYSSGRKMDKLLIESGKGLMRLNNFNLSLSTRFAPKGADKPKQTPKGTPEQLKFINENPELYVDFNIPWTLNLSYNYSYSRQGIAQGYTTQTLRVNGDFSLTKQWKFVWDSGYDFEAKAPSITTLTISRDLHCWDMSFNWTPFAAAGSGRSSNYSFDLKVKSSILQDLKISRRRSFYDRGGF